MGVTWDQITEQCNVPMELSIIVSNNMDNHPWDMLAAGRIIERLQLDEIHIKRCENWIWFQFGKIADAVAFKLSWEE